MLRGLVLWTAMLPWIGASADVGSHQLAEVRDIGRVSLSPDGRWAAFGVQSPDVAHNRRGWAYWVVPVAGGAARQVTPETDAFGDHLHDNLFALAAPVWSSDGRWLYYRAFVQGQVQVWRAAVNGTTREAVTADAADVESFVLDDAHRRVIYTTRATRAQSEAAEHDTEEQGVVIDDTVTLVFPVLRSHDFRGRKVTVRRGLDGMHRLGDHAVRYKVKLLGAGSAREADAAARSAIEHAAEAKLSDGQRVAELTAADATPAPLMQETAEPESVVQAVDRSSGRATRCGDARCRAVPHHLQLLGWSGGEIVFARQDESGASHLYGWRPDTDVLRTIANSPGLFGAGTGYQRYDVGPCPIAGAAALCTTAQADQPPRLETINLATGARHVLFDPNAALRALHGNERVEYLSWKDRWGREQTGVLIVPRTASAPLPMVITSYRCTGYLRGGGGGDVPEHVLAAHGLIALCINSNDAYSHVPHPSGTVRHGPSTDGLRSDLDAWEAAVDVLAARGLADRAHVGISGASWSGRLVHYAISQSHYFAAAASSGAGDDDPGSYIFIGPKGSIYRVGLERLKGLPAPRNDPEGRWKEVSPALNVDRITAPLLVQSSDTEFLMDLDLFTAMADADKAMELVVFPGESHLISQPRHKVRQYERNVDWFRFWLQGAEDATPSKRAQYQRWRALKARLSGAQAPS